MSKNMDTTLALKALDNTFKIEKPAEGLVLHSDLGSQYTSYEFRNIKNTKIKKSWCFCFV